VNYLLDTNAVSEVNKAHPDPNVMRWLSQKDRTQTCIAAVTIGEIAYGIARAKSADRKRKLHQWFSSVKRNYAGRILPLETLTLEAWGVQDGDAEYDGRPIGILDCMIGVTAVTYGLTLVTRNTTHFQWLSVAVLNPWLETP
jgi:toxin FitB